MSVWFSHWWAERGKVKNSVRIGACFYKLGPKVELLRGRHKRSHSSWVLLLCLSILIYSYSYLNKQINSIVCHLVYLSLRNKDRVTFNWGAKARKTQLGLFMSQLGFPLFIVVFILSYNKWNYCWQQFK